MSATAAGLSLQTFARGLVNDARRMSLPLLGVSGVLLAVGVLFIYGTGHQTGGRFALLWVRQVQWICLGSGAMLVAAFLDYRWLGRYSWLVYLGTLALLGLVLVIGIKVNGARSWLRIGPGMNLQPSELAKLGVMIPVAYLASRPYMQLQRWRELVPFAFLAAPPVLLIGLQPDYGSALSILPFVVGIVFVSGLRWRIIWISLAAVLVFSPAMYRYGLADHQKERLRVFLNPGAASRDASWNARQSLLAVGSGGLRGKGYMRGTQNVLGFLPRTVAPSDFVFSVIAEETGFVGSTAVVGLLATFVILCVYVASKAPDRFGRNLAAGIAILVSTHIYINVGMTVGMAPIIGIPLPFVSYGGSFMILMMSCLGILQSIYIRREVF